MKIIILTLSILTIAGLGLVIFKPKQQLPSETTDNSIVKLVNSQEFKKLTKQENAFILYVHTPEQTHIPDTNAFIPYDQIKENQNQLPTDKTTPILVYCRSGNMSSEAAQDLVKLGYTNIYDLAGGTNAYKEQQAEISLWPAKTSLGTVIYGDVATTSFTLTNYTPLPIKINKISTSCGCTKAEIETTEVAAYESTTVNVSFDPAVHNDDTDIGDLTRTVYIETDNPNFPELESVITATVIKKN